MPGSSGESRGGSTAASPTSTSGACGARSASTSSTSRSRPGDYVLNHVGFAIRRIPPEEIGETLALYETLLAEAAKDDLMAADVRGEIAAAGRPVIENADVADAVRQLKFRDPARARRWSRRSRAVTKEIGRSPVSVMHVCGSHEQAIAKFGLRATFPEDLNVIMGPGCPVCITDMPEVDEASRWRGRAHVVATYGDMLRVPRHVDVARRRPGRGRRRSRSSTA